MAILTSYAIPPSQKRSQYLCPSRSPDRPKSYPPPLRHPPPLLPRFLPKHSPSRLRPTQTPSTNRVHDNPIYSSTRNPLSPLCTLTAHADLPFSSPRTPFQRVFFFSNCNAMPCGVVFLHCSCFDGFVSHTSAAAHFCIAASEQSESSPRQLTLPVVLPDPDLDLDLDLACHPIFFQLCALATSGYL